MTTYFNQPSTKRFFERSSFNSRELFTKDISGHGDDVPASKWKNGVAQNAGIVGLAATSQTNVPAGQSPFPYVDLSDSLPLRNIEGKRFIGISCFYKINSESLGNNLLMLTNDITKVNSGLHIAAFPSGGGVPVPHIIVNLYGFTTDFAWVGSDYINSQVKVGEWQHLFYYCDLDELDADPTATPHLYIDGVSNSQYKGRTLVDWPTNGFQSFKRGYTHSTLYSIANDEPFIGASTMSISNLYMSNTSDFKNQLDKYRNLPTIEVV